jgi:serine phosphatase RsbU (regulator of sigma subunit)/PAS domain-containing protein/anti-sigma regulatory factor (Ser/Thr protein kinase)
MMQDRGNGGAVPSQLRRRSRTRETRPRQRIRTRRLSTRILLAQLAILAFTGVLGFGLLGFAENGQLNRTYEQQAASLAWTAASDPVIRNAMAAGTDHGAGVVQAAAERIRTASGASYVVVIGLDRVRHSHPDPALIGQRVSEPLVAADGRAHLGIDRGATGQSANARVPLYAPGPPGGRLVGEVSVGIPETRTLAEIWRSAPAFGLVAAATLAAGVSVSLLLARRLKRSTFGLELDEIAGLLQDREAMLHGIREGVICFDAGGRITVINEEARRLLDLPPDAEGRRLPELGVDPATSELLSPGHVITDQVLPAGDRLLAVNNRPTDFGGGPPGSVATLRDSTELRLLSRKADVARKRLKLLYEASVAIGTSLDAAESAQQLVQVAVPRFADYATVDLAGFVVRGEEPTARETVELRRIALSGVRDDSPLTQPGEPFVLRSATPQARGFGHGEALLQRDLPGTTDWRAQDPARAEALLRAGFHSLVVAPLHARGVLLGMVHFWRAAESAPFDEDDLSLAEELAARAAVCIDNARRFAREHTMAVALQHSLLPRALPEQHALAVAYRYLPATAGVGGDWFDVIPLPGARVALVVGDVVGHGLRSAVTMGRLRTAVHNFSSLDLPPEEILGRLSELVHRIDQSESVEALADGEPVPVTGATCLYAVYDPTTRRCVMARAGHPPPAVVRPDGWVEFADVPAGPPLGLVGLPYETAELELAEDSQVVLYTDGLVETRSRDIDAGLDRLRKALAEAHTPERDPDQTCAAVLDALLPARPDDDVALIVARTRALPEDRIAAWDVAPDPAMVGEIRRLAMDRLEEWGVADAAFTTELILSELVTNAIRYAGGPIGVRLVLPQRPGAAATCLICEVSDASSTSPHLRQAADTEEHGRGLFLVARLSERWGTRYTPTGKIIWSEQRLS